jgi:hypothetical protein
MHGILPTPSTEEHYDACDCGNILYSANTQYIACGALVGFDPPRSELMRSRYVQSLMFAAQCFLSFPQVLSSLVHNATPRAIVTGCSPLDPRMQTAPLAS